MEEERVIRATFDKNSITVYQAFSKKIAEVAVEAQTFVTPPFKLERMTWIKPSFLWMMYRSGWATKENQEYILAVKIKREAFEWALKNSCLSHFNKEIHKNHDEWKAKLKNSPVRIQWDPEKNLYLQPLPYRSIQIGLTGIAVKKYVSDWIINIDNITDFCKNIHHLVRENRINEIKDLLPIENQYPLPRQIKESIHYSIFL